MMSNRSLSTVFSLVLMALLLGGCAGSAKPESRVVYDLVKIFPLAVSRLEVKGPPPGISGTEGFPREPSPETTPRDPGSKRATPGARVDREAEELRIPFGARVDYFLRLPPGSVLATGGVRTTDDLATLTVLVQRQGEKEEVLTEVAGQAGPFTIPIASVQRPITRISFRARAGGDSGPIPGEVILRSPVLRGASLEGGNRALHASVPTWEGQRPNVIIYLIDALRADSLGCYGHDRPLSPNIDALAREGIRFENAMAQAPFTVTAVSSIFTGAYPDTHGVTRHGIILPAELMTMAEILRRLGYRTVAFTTNPGVGKRSGLDRGFDDLVLLPASAERRSVHALSDKVNERVFAWLEAHRDDPVPFFLYIHTTDPHSPYTPPLEFLERVGGASVDPDLGTMEGLSKSIDDAKSPAANLSRHLMTLYEGEVAFNDHHFGKLIEELRRRGKYENSIIVLMSDHGEEFYEHGGWQHMTSLHAESLNIPLIVKFPGTEARVPDGGEAAARRVDVAAQQSDLVQGQVDIAAWRRDLLPQQVDLLPTILRALGVTIPKQVEGRDLRTLMRRGDDLAPRRGYAYFDIRDRVGVSVVEGRWKLIHEKMKGSDHETLELFDLELDPGEERNLTDEAPVVLGYLQAALRAREARGALLEAEESDIDEELRKQLEALGYVD